MKSCLAVAATLLAGAGGALAVSVNAPASASVLDNGLKVIVHEDHSTDLVAVDVWIRAGSIDETEETNGVSHFIEHLLFRATERRGPGEIDMEIESLGASIEARASRDWTHVFTVVARRYLHRALDVLADAVTRPKFRSEDIEHERRVIADEIARRDSDPFALLERHIYRAAYNVHPYRLPVEGSSDSIAKITRDVIVSHYRRLYVPTNMAVVLAGDVTPAEAVPAVGKAFAHVEKRPAPESAAPKEPPRTQRTREVVKQDTKLSYLGIAFHAPSVKDRPDVYAMDVLLSHLGVGYQSWLESDLKDRQDLAVQASSDFLTSRDPGLAILMVAVERSKVEKAEEAIFARIADLRTKPIDEASLARAKRSLESAFAFDVETFSGRAATLGFYEAIDSFEFARSYVQNIRQVTAKDVLELAKKYLDPERAVIVVLGP